MITKLSDSSWIKINMDGKVIYFDPGFMGAFQTYRLPKSEYEEPADIIFITHHHQDHLNPDFLASIFEPKTFILAPKICQDKIEFNFQQVKPGDTLSHDTIKIQVVYAYNTPLGHSTVKAHHKGEGVGYIITINQITIYHSGDTDFIPEMKNLPPIDIAFLPIGGTYTMDIGEACQAVKTIQPKIVIPMHFLQANPEELKKLLDSEKQIQVAIIKPGESIDF